MKTPSRLVLLLVLGLVAACDNPTEPQTLASETGGCWLRWSSPVQDGGGEVLVVEAHATPCPSAEWLAENPDWTRID